MKDFAAIDFETANHLRSSVCSVGIVIVRNGEITDKFYSLIYPRPNFFTYWTAQVHGLTMQDMEDALPFPDVWKQIAPKIEGLPLVAHNSPFDESCLKAVFEEYQMDYPDYKFHCTCRASRKNFPNAENRQLHTISALCGYNLNCHHHALADAEACAEIAKKYCKFVLFKKINFYMSDLNHSLVLLDKVVQYCQNTTKILLSYIKEVEILKCNPQNRPLYKANLLDCLNPTEPNTSEMLKILFSYKQEGQYIIFRSFVKTFLEPIGFKLSDIHDKCIRITAETERIDLWIQDDMNYSIIFENKLKGASYQRNQLGRYIQKQINHGYNEKKIYIVLLPQHNEDNYISAMASSIWKYPLDACKSTNWDRICAIDNNLCWCDANITLDTYQLNHCNKCKDFYHSFKSRTVVVENNFSDWLLSTISLIDEREVILKAAINIFADYIKYLYGTRINNQLIMDITRFLKNELLDNGNHASDNFDIVLTKIDEAQALLQGLQKLKEEVAKDLIDEWYCELKEKWPKLMHEQHKSLGMKINDVWIGCWSGDGKDKFSNNGMPFWGFLKENARPEQINMVNEILDDCGITQKNSSSNWISWFSTRHGSQRCNEFYSAAKRLGYLKD